MEIIKSWEQTEAEIRKYLERPFVDEVEVTEAARQRTRAVWGEPLTPARAVERILQDVRARGDAAVIEYARKLDGASLTGGNLFVSESEFEAAAFQVTEEFKQALQLARDNIAAFHSKQKRNSWISTEANGVILGQRIIPLDRVGIYVPGGTAPLVSTVLMCAVPARVAGVKEIIMASPVGASGVMDPHLLWAARLAGVDKVLKVGGAQAVAALAYGTETVPRVDKIVGPGNIYVTLAKKMVFGRVGIESLAGPSEILVLADASADPRHIAADLLSQAEHDPEAAAILVTTSVALAEAVAGEVARQLARLSRREVAETSWQRHGVILVCRDIQEAARWVNVCAPEHLEIVVENPWEILHLIRHAGAIFLGAHACEPLGDYVAGPNHVLPTNGTARFSSPLGVEDFVKRSSIISYTAAGLERVGRQAVRLAEVEGLDAHARAVRIRLEQAHD